MPPDNEFPLTRPIDEWRQVVVRRGQRRRLRRRTALATPVLLALVGLTSLPFIGSGVRPNTQLHTAGRPEGGGVSAGGAGSTNNQSSNTSSGATSSNRPGTSSSGGRATAGLLGGEGNGPGPGTGALSSKGEVAFVRADGSGSQIYVVSAAGGRPTRLTPTGVSDSGPAWSPDGKRLAFASNDGAYNQTNIWVMNADGTHRQQVSNAPGVDFPNCGSASSNSTECWDSTPAWSPDGTHIAFTRSPDKPQLAGCGTGYQACPSIEVVSIGDHSEQRLTGGRDPSWSPDGRTIVFENAWKAQAQCPACDYGDLYTIRYGVAGAQPVDLGVVGSAAEFSPDGHSLTYTAPPSSPNGGPEVAVFSLAGHSSRLLTTGFAGCFASDGSHLFFWDWISPSNANGPTAIFVIGIDGKARQELSDSRGSASDSFPACR